MTKLMIAPLAIVILAGVGWWVSHIYYTPTTVDSENSNYMERSTTTAVTSSVNSDVKIYSNEEWGFQFNYPNDWNVREPAFVSAVSLFNIAVEPNNKLNPEAIFINITPKDWLESAHTKMRARGVDINETTLSSRNALFAESEEGLGGATENYYVLMNDEYWIHISGQKRQKEAFDQFLESFLFLE